MKLYHGSMYLNDDGYLMSGFLRSGELVKWDKTETNEWLYAIGDIERAVALGVASAVEKVFKTKRWSERGKHITIESYSNGDPITLEAMKELEVYVYEIERTEMDKWVYVNNEVNNIDNEFKTKNKVRYNNYSKVDVPAWLAKRKITFTTSNDEMSLESFKPQATDEPGWFKVPGYPSHLAHRDGRVKNAKTGYETKGSADDQGYLRTSIWNNETQKKMDVKVHILVCSAFHGPKPKDHEVGHSDDVRGNNAATNLRWVTRLANMQKRHSMESNTFNW